MIVDLINSIPCKLKYGSDSLYSRKLKNERMSEVESGYVRPSLSLSSLIKSKINYDGNLLKEVRSLTENDVFTGVNVCFDSESKSENKVILSKLMNQSSMTNLVIASKRYNDNLINSFDGNYSDNEVVLKSEIVFKSLVSLYKDEKRKDELDFILLIESCLTFWGYVREKDLSLSDFLSVMSDKSNLKTIIPKTTLVELEKICFKNKFMVASDNLALIDKNASKFNSDELNNLFSLICFDIERIKKSLGVVRVKSIGDMKFLFIDDIKPIPKLVELFLSFTCADFIDGNLDKLKQTATLEGFLHSDAEDNLNVFEQISIFSSSSSKVLSENAFEMAMKYRKRINFCLVNQVNDELVISNELVNRVGYICFDNLFYVAVKKCIIDGRISGLFIGRKDIDFSFIYLSNQYESVIY